MYLAENFCKDKKSVINAIQIEKLKIEYNIFDYNVLCGFFKFNASVLFVNGKIIFGKIHLKSLINITFATTMMKCLGTVAE